MKYITPILFAILVLVLLLVAADAAMAQCPMCKSAVESSLQTGDNTAIGLNKGILYLLLMPYLFYALIFLAWYFSNREKTAGN